MFYSSAICQEPRLDQKKELDCLNDLLAGIFLDIKQQLQQKIVNCSDGSPPKDK